MNKPKVIIRVGEKLNLNGNDITVTEVMKGIGFYYSDGSDELMFCNTMFETLNFEPVFK